MESEIQNVPNSTTVSPGNGTDIVNEETAEDLRFLIVPLIVIAIVMLLSAMVTGWIYLVDILLTSESIAGLLYGKAQALQTSARKSYSPLRLWLQRARMGDTIA